MPIIHPLIDRFTRLLASALIYSALANAGFTQNSGPGLPPSAATVSIMVTDTNPGASAQVAASSESSAAPARWTDIKDCPSEMRGAFFDGLGRLEAIVNNQTNELTARRATTKNPVEIKNLDLAIQNMGNARFYLTAMGELLSGATPLTWEQQKLKVGLAWAKTQEVYANVRVKAGSID